MRKLNLTNQVFGRLTVLRQVDGDRQGTRWLCSCECGEQTTVSGKMLTSGNTKACGCLRNEPQGPDVSGQKFGRLLVVSRAETIAKRAYWNCLCDCGNEFKAMAKCLRAKMTASCGCLLKEWQTQAASIAVNKPDGEASAHQIYLNYKRNAEIRGRSFDLSEEYFRTLTKGDCFYCGAKPSQIHLHTNRRKTDTGYTYNGVDRKDNSKGYTVENAVSCCGTHNRMKMKMSPEEFLQACLSVVAHYGKNVAGACS